MFFGGAMPYQGWDAGSSVESKHTNLSCVAIMSCLRRQALQRKLIARQYHSRDNKFLEYKTSSLDALVQEVRPLRAVSFLSRIRYNNCDNCQQLGRSADVYTNNTNKPTMKINRYDVILRTGWKGESDFVFPQVRTFIF